MCIYAYMYHICNMHCISNDMIWYGMIWLYVCEYYIDMCLSTLLFVLPCLRLLSLVDLRNIAIQYYFCILNSFDYTSSSDPLCHYSLSSQKWWGQDIEPCHVFKRHDCEEKNLEQAHGLKISCQVGPGCLHLRRLN